MTTRDEQGSLELWLEVVRGIVGRPTEGLTLLDLCCNECTGTRELGCKIHVGVDLVDWPTRPTNVVFKQNDALFELYKIRADSFDICICSDGIEHINQPDGLRLLQEMPLIAHISLIFTPSGPYMLDPDATHPDAHKSAWTPEEFEAMGWEVTAFPRWHPTLNVGAFFASKGKLD